MDDARFDTVVQMIRHLMAADRQDTSVLEVSDDSLWITLPLPHGAKFRMSRSHLSSLGSEDHEVAEEAYRVYREHVKLAT